MLPIQIHQWDLDLIWTSTLFLSLIIIILILKNLIFFKFFQTVMCLLHWEIFSLTPHNFSRLRTVQKIRRKRLVLVINNGHNRKSTKFNCHFIKPVPVLQMRLDRINLPDPDPPFICTGNWSVIKKFKKVIHIDVPEQYWGFFVLSS